MTDRTPQNDQAPVPPAGNDAVASPAGRLVPVLGLWGGGTALLAIAIAWNRGSADSASIAAVTVFAAMAAGLGLLAMLSPRSISGWAFPMLGAQMVRTLLAPALGLAVYFLVPALLHSLPGGAATLEPKAFWLTLLAVAAAMLVGETIAISKMFGSASRRSVENAAAGREAVA